jgi:hypothetical protein
MRTGSPLDARCETKAAAYTRQADMSEESILIETEKLSGLAVLIIQLNSRFTAAVKSERRMGSPFLKT